LPRRFSAKRDPFLRIVLILMPVGSARCFTASLSQPTSPYVVGEKICEIVESAGWQLRYPVGPDAEPFLKWRASKIDEEIVQLGGATDDEFKSIVKREFGLDVAL